MTLVRFIAVAFVAIILASCTTPEPIPISYGEDQCTACKMNIVDAKYGAEAVTTTGKTYVFDAPECLLGWYLAEGDVSRNDIHSLWVSDFSNPGTLIDARTAVFLESDNLHSPMSMNVAAFSSETDRDAVMSEVKGTKLEFEGVLDLAEDYR